MLRLFANTNLIYHSILLQGEVCCPGVQLFTLKSGLQVSKHNLHWPFLSKEVEDQGVYCLGWNGNILENDILVCTVAFFKHTQAETWLVRFHSSWNCSRAPWEESLSTLLSAWGLSTTSTRSYFSSLIVLWRSVSGIKLHLASQSGWNQIPHWPNNITAEPSSWASSSPLPSGV